jgi:hypothetical protein
LDINEDRELKDWLSVLGDTYLDGFLYAISVAATKATDEDYSIIRPALMDLKRKYREGQLRMQHLYRPLPAGRGAA